MKLMRNNQRGNLILALNLFIALIAVLWLSWWSINALATYAAEKCPDKWERQIFSTSLTSLNLRSKPASIQEQMAAKVFNKLKFHTHLRKLNYNLYFDESETPNAFAYPGGAIVLTKGLLKLVKTEIGLAMVIGHEIGHLEKRHSLKAMGQSLILGGVLALTVGSDLGILSGTVVNLAQKSHSRDQETEADDFGARLVFKKYKTTKGSLEFFEKMAKYPTYENGKIASLLSTHPYSTDRLNHLKKLSKALAKKKHLNNSQ